jgi:hypothetical protein
LSFCLISGNFCSAVNTVCVAWKSCSNYVLMFSRMRLPTTMNGIALYHLITSTLSVFLKWVNDCKSVHYAPCLLFNIFVTTQGQNIIILGVLWKNCQQWICSWHLKGLLHICHFLKFAR